MKIKVLDLDRNDEERLYRKVVLGENLGMLFQVPNDLTSMFRTIKKYYKVQDDESVISILISTEYHRIISNNK